MEILTGNKHLCDKVVKNLQGIRINCIEEPMKNNLCRKHYLRTINNKCNICRNEFAICQGNKVTFDPDSFGGDAVLECSGFEISNRKLCLNEDGQ
jgi:hypothetical protein